MSLLMYSALLKKKNLWPSHSVPEAIARPATGRESRRCFPTVTDTLWKPGEPQRKQAGIDDDKYFPLCSLIFYGSVSLVYFMAHSLQLNKHPADCKKTAGKMEYIIFPGRRDLINVRHCIFRRVFFFLF